MSTWSSAQISEREATYSLDELERLAKTAGAQVAGRVQQQRTLPDAKTYVGKGKAEEIRALVEELEVDTIITNQTALP